MNRNIMGWALALALVGCGGSSAESATSQGEGEHAGGEHHGGHEHDALPPALHGFHEVLAPIWHSEEGATRSALACESDSLHDLESAADDVEAMSIPEGVDENEWHAAADDLAATVDGVAGACEAGGDEAEAKLAEVHEAFHTAAGLAGHGHDAAPAPEEEASVEPSEEGAATEEGTPAE